MLEDLKCRNIKIITIGNRYHCIGFGEKIEELELLESSVSKEEPHTSGAQTYEEGTHPAV